MRRYLKLIILVIIVLGLIKLTWNCREGFESYNDCIANGYTKEFCVQTPTSAISPNVCTCDNGMTGRRLPGFKGQCICNNQFLKYFKSIFSSF